MEVTPQKNIETDRALSSLKTTVKLLMATLTALFTYFANCHLIAVLISTIALLYSLFLAFNQKAITILVQYFQRGTPSSTQQAGSTRFITSLTNHLKRRLKFP